MSNNNKHYCKYCKIFVQDNISVKNHEDGWRHKNNVTRFVSTQNRDKKYQERDQKEAEREINRIKSTGTKSFREKDLSRVLDEKRQAQQQQQQPHQQQQQQQSTTDPTFKEIINQQRQQISNNDYYNYYQDKQKLIYNYYQQEENSIQPEPPLNTSLYGYTDSPGLKYSSSSNDTDTNSGSMNSSTSSFTTSQRKRKQDNSNSPIPTKISRDQSDEPINEAEKEEEEEEEDNDEKERSGSDNDEEESSSSSEIDQSESIVGQWETVSSHESAFGSTRPDTDDECNQEDDEVKQCKKDDDGKDYSDISDVDSEEEEINITKRAFSNNRKVATIVSPTIPQASKSFENKLSFNKSGVFTAFALNGNNNKNTTTTTTTTSTTPIQPTAPISLKFNKPLKQRNIRKTNIEDKQT